MDLRDKKYNLLFFIGFLLLVISLVLVISMPDNFLWAGILGLAYGWISAIFVIRFLIAQEGIKKSRQRSEAILKELEETFQI